MLFCCFLASSVSVSLGAAADVASLHSQRKGEKKKSRKRSPCPCHRSRAWRSSFFSMPGERDAAFFLSPLAFFFFAALFKPSTIDTRASRRHRARVSTQGTERNQRKKTFASRVRSPLPLFLKESKKKKVKKGPQFEEQRKRKKGGIPLSFVPIARIERNGRERARPKGWFLRGDGPARRSRGWDGDDH